MSVPLQAIRAKGDGIAAGLRSLTAKERERDPTQPFVEDYNRFRNLAAESCPDLVAAFPPEVVWSEWQGMTPGGPDAKYADLLSYVEQILRLLPSAGGPAVFLGRVR
jgi:hypothetical protein